MEQALKDFSKQFRYNPQIENKEAYKKGKKIVVCGMGGSHLSADIVRDVAPEIDITIHSDYGLPYIDSKDYKKTLVIASSYSGNTEEVIDSFNKALELGLDLIVIATGGKLIELAQNNDVAYIELPDTGIQPRSALGFSFMALLKAIGQRDLIKIAKSLPKTIKPKDYEQIGKQLAKNLQNKIPVVYASQKNFSVCYNWKIKFNETGKIPAFYNVLPELNHNEMTGFDGNEKSAQLNEKFYFIFLKDNDDHPQVQKRMEVIKKLYENRNMPVEIVEMEGKNRLEKIFTCLLIADWSAVNIAKYYGLESEQVPMVEEFKKLI